jgi:uncharacterized membrane protein
VTTAEQSSTEPAKVVKRSDTISTIVFLAVSTGLVFVVTRLAAVPISAFNGQEFDLGDVMIFTFAWTFGPGIGAFAGGVGSALSDASIPSPFAPFTLIIKGTEGFLAGYISRRGSTWSLSLSWIFASIVMVGGYFVTNWLILGYGFVAGLYEVPFDAAQVIAGGLIGRPVAQYLRNSLPSIVPIRKNQPRKDSNPGV